MRRLALLFALLLTRCLSWAALIAVAAWVYTTIATTVGAALGR